MPTLFKRRYLRGKPKALERFVGFGLLVLLGAIILAFMVSGGLLAETVENVSPLRALRDVIGLDRTPLFDSMPDEVKPPHADRVAEVMLPTAAGSWKRRAMAAWPVGREDGAHRIAQALSSLESPPDAARVEAAVVPEDQLRDANAHLVCAGVYDGGAGGKQTETASALAWVIDAGSAVAARELFGQRRPAAAQAARVGCEAWFSEDGREGGCWAGRYYTEVAVLSGERPLRTLLNGVVSRQVVYGVVAPPDKAVASGDKDSADAKPQAEAPAVASFAEVPGGDLVAPLKIEVYTDNLYEKINGKEGMFRAYLFEELRFGQYQDRRNQTVFDVYIYDMGLPENAFGIYMAERSHGGKAYELGRAAYTSGASAYFAKDRYYVNVLGPEGDGDATVTMSKRIAEAIAVTIPDTDEPFWVEALLPADGVTIKTFKYYATSALGYAFLERLYLAECEAGDQTFEMFVIRATDATEAEALLGKYAEATGKYGEVLSRDKDDQGEILVGESLGVYTVAFARGVFFGGVSECADKELAITQAKAFRDRLPTGGASP